MQDKKALLKREDKKMKVVIIIAIVLVALFLLSLIIYYFNLDMKMSAVMEKMLTGRYDKMKRDKKL